MSSTEKPSAEETETLIWRPQCECGPRQAVGEGARVWCAACGKPYTCRRDAQLVALCRVRTCLRRLTRQVKDVCDTLDAANESVLGGLDDGD